MRMSSIGLAAGLLLVGAACLPPETSRGEDAPAPVSSAALADAPADSYPLEVMLVLDRSGSMTGTPISELKSAATSFVNLFAGSQGRDRMGLISFAAAVAVPCAMDTDFVAPMVAAINAMTASGATNAEDALDQADGPAGFTDQVAVPCAQRARQALVFFSDGSPTAFRGNFGYRDANYDAVACVTGNCADGEYDMYDQLCSPITGATLATASPMPTGDGTSTRIRCSSGSSLTYTTRWYVFDTDPVPDGSGGYYSATANCIPESRLHDQTCVLATILALAHAQELKDKGVTIYAIGLGSNVNTAFLQQLASSPSTYYYAPTADQLEAVFEAVAYSLLPPATPVRHSTFGGLKARYR